MDGTRDEPPPPYFGDHPDGAYWSAVRPDDAVDEEDEPAVAGDTIQFMWDYGAVVPLWDAEGGMPDDPAWLRAAMGLSDALIEALTAWGTEMNRLDSVRWEVEPRSSWEREYRAADARARELVGWLRREVGDRYRVVYRPWITRFSDDPG